MICAILKESFSCKVEFMCIKPVIELRNIDFVYPPSLQAKEKPVFKGLSLKVEQGSILVVNGPSGSGKTTLLRLLSSMEEPGGGSIYFEGRDYREFDPPALRRKISMTPQIPVMLEGDTRRNLCLGLNKPAPDEALLSWMGRFGLEPELLGKRAESLSVGQKQRACVIRNILVDPVVLLLDEPTASIDPASSERFVKQMVRLSKERGLTLVWNSHDISVVGPVADRVISIDRICDDN